MRFLLLTLVVVSSAAQAAPRGIKLMEPMQEQPLVERAAGDPVIVYANPWGARYTRGSHNSSQNTSGILSVSSANISPLPATTEEWAWLYDCIKGQFAPFNVIVTDQDPGAAEHIEASIGGTPQAIGMGAGVGGVGPAGCSFGGQGIYHSRAVVFNFENQGVGHNMCWTVAQEVGHALGMDHQMLCADPMTYLTGCGFEKTFQDQYSRCGENFERNCQCGNAQQNSFQHIKDLAGIAEDNESPNINILFPPDEGFAPVGFTMRVRATDDRDIQRVEVKLNGEYFGEGRWGFTDLKTPFTLGLGEHQIEVIATDIFGKTSVKTSSFTLTTDGQPPECFKDSECSAGQVCWQLKCFADAGQSGNGQTCENNSDCLSQNCATYKSEALCAVTCDQLNPCTQGFECTKSGEANICWPEKGGSGSSGCDSSGAPLVVLLMVFAMGLLPRRRASL